MINYIKTLLKKRKESLEKSKDSYRIETLERRLKELPSNKNFKFLDIYDPFEFPLIVTSEDVARFLEQKRIDNQVIFEHYLKCLECDATVNLPKEEKKVSCRLCKHSIEINSDTTFISFKKI